MHLLDTPTCRTHLAEHLGLVNFTVEPTDLAELIRCELYALGVISRRVLADRVMRLLQPVAQIERDSILNVIRQLEAMGDITPGPGGNLASAPLRAVHLAGQRYLLVGTLPTHSFTRAFPHASLQQRFPRHLILTQPQEDALRTTVTGLGGIIIDVSRWAGLARTPVADAAWLAELDARLQTADTIVDLAPIAWSKLQFYTPEPLRLQHQRWKEKRPAGEVHLIRERQPGGWYAYAWQKTTSLTPLRLRLNRDESRRTMFALDARDRFCVELQADLTDTDATLKLDVLLPHAEYRYLLGVAAQLPTEGFPLQFTMPLSVWPEVANMLQERLQMAIIENQVHG